jgi:hypothetical protein
MKAVAYFQNLPIDDPESLQDVVLPEPQPGPRDLLESGEAKGKIVLEGFA